MQLFLILTTAVVIQAAVIKPDEEKQCDGVIIDGIYHDIEVLKTDIDRPYLLTVDHKTNTVFFSYSLDENDDRYQAAYVNLNTKEFADVVGVNEGFVQTVDQKNHEVYIGGNDGIYKYNYRNKSAEFIGAKDANIWSMFFKDILYYSVYPSESLYTFVDGESVIYKDLEDIKVFLFVIDNEDMMYYSNSTGFYSQKKGTKEATLYKKFRRFDVRGLAIDANGDTFVCLSDGIYKVNKSDILLNKIVDINDAFGLAFDNDNNIVYSDDTKLVRLKPNKDKSC